jgi:hypothetical protein
MRWTRAEHREPFPASRLDCPRRDDGCDQSCSWDSPRAAGALPLDPRPGSKRAVEFKTVADVGAWVKANMPPKSAGTLSDDQYWAILAFDLKANGIDLGGKKLDAALAQTLVIPR